MTDEDLLHKVHTLESNHQSFVYELRQTNATLVKIENAIERQNEIMMDVRLLRAEMKAHIEKEEDSAKRQDERILKLENNQSKVAWMVLTPVVVAVVGLIIKG